ncbi:RNA 2',3'-cyclic phosphodiesterase [Epidermidibacterium keratini]|uniref:RNA 2',3'-cyclic phosphodiesterase n=1 Tax=Epidermidibacterium keratini TaxID=1891644 RepID=A0A7L4YQ16_9ACTN|nr:RNA 2',3'-cyclic phosphodiesterase [Epidermidibacterium keratini]QHC01112.1 RNA 2',3'-cyclic phosphodiesterase [Epidermidibacterium keratini]
MARIFVAAQLPLDVRDDLHEHLDVLRTVHPSLRWVRAENLHLTVRFIGESGPREVDRQVEHWAERAADAAPFSVSLSGAGCFPQTWRARVLYAAAGVDEPSWRHLAGPDQQPHVTVARTRELSDLTGLVDELAAYSSRKWEIEQIAVMRSFLERGRPARYEPLEVLPLGR